MISVGIIGASGYTGGELLRLLENHRDVEVVHATSRQYSGVPVSRVHPHLQDTDLKFQDMDPGRMDADVIFTATPHGASMKIVPEIIERGIMVVDLSGDYRFEDTGVYEEWYGMKHEHPLDAVYGLPEIHREKIRKAQLVANPGCFPTGAILACLPLVYEKIADTFIIDSKTGVSGAGVKPTSLTHYPECSDNVIPYNVTSHRHTPEIRQELSRINPVRLSFTPHLVPVTRGILTSAHTFLREDLESDELMEIFTGFYDGEPFVRVVDGIPRLSAVRGSNFCHIGCFEVDENQRAVIVSAIDNLVKGASGQAVQNMNIMCGLNEVEGLDFPGMHP
ncbi:N-acetyl-gamma-glutamyl-phosphate reductase [Methanothermobacter wolfeii]|uniref:N-acetyl-gamma-glutamyl-phosphate reductase n=1 Tax=Methanothermobacter wolfeii TaxID=145261 RepID=A0A9E7RRU8_METWO|nr:MULTISPECIES: N-acetyl-gamma-glutamyl-phosphate reductase [Methanothermobacter]NLM02431.1 N-acetyl-gamma-glutamyl-phosphate reductase [Methanothermobacter wolfeii]QHN06597.1 N-acetyl-gamma-glutamyl-phosphate reductase [Methanothermobacter sp. THM-1]UXH31149.1 N-acetyl-gamma-glutamyl-phosphate reductase [Methanothermobacter wolfeii]SCM57720.1 N-acetyl-gamma-glutamyl-phosphate reductase [Methanothermobacter wolfeii]